MTSKYEEVQQTLKNSPKKWLITGVAGFIGSNLLETLLQLVQTVIGLDNFSTGPQANLDEVRSLVSSQQLRRFSFIEGDIRDLATCSEACSGVDYILHQAALGSVPRSIEDPITTNANNISGFLNMLVAARDAKVSRFVYAASRICFSTKVSSNSVRRQWRVGRCGCEKWYTSMPIAVCSFHRIARSYLQT